MKHTIYEMTKDSRFVYVGEIDEDGINEVENPLNAILDGLLESFVDVRNDMMNELKEGLTVCEFEIFPFETDCSLLEQVKKINEERKELCDALKIWLTTGAYSPEAIKAGCDVLEEAIDILQATVNFIMKFKNAVNDLPNANDGRKLSDRAISMAFDNVFFKNYNRGSYDARETV